MMEEEEEVELFGREEEGFIFVSCGVGCDVDFTITKDDGATGFGLGAGQHALHPGENFFNPEGLSDVVICSDLKAKDDVVAIAFRGEK